jgi:hypothetical protein
MIEAHKELNWLIILACLGLICVCLGGCITTTDADGNTTTRPDLPSIIALIDLYQGLAEEHAAEKPSEEGEEMDQWEAVMDRIERKKARLTDLRDKLESGAEADTGDVARLKRAEAFSKKLE